MDSKKIGSLMRILCDPVPLCLIFICLIPIFYAIKKKNGEKKSSDDIRNYIYKNIASLNSLMNDPKIINGH